MIKEEVAWWDCFLACIGFCLWHQLNEQKDSVWRVREFLRLQFQQINRAGDGLDNGVVRLGAPCCPGWCCIETPTPALCSLTLTASVSSYPHCCPQFHSFFSGFLNDFCPLIKNHVCDVYAGYSSLYYFPPTPPAAPPPYKSLPFIY